MANNRSGKRVATKPRKPVFMAVQGAAVIVGVAFVLLGLLGFVPGVTTNYDTLRWAGHHSGAELFGVFEVSGLLNVVHLAFGVVGLAMARTFVRSRAFLLGGGLLYLALWVYGLLMDRASEANVVPLNNADNWLHFGLGVVMIILGLTLAATHDPTKPGH